MPRHGGRGPNQLRPVTITPGYHDFAEGSCLITWGRTQEISRLLGRSLRAVVDLADLGPRTVILDCDVLQAMLALAQEGLRVLCRMQTEALSPWLPLSW
jgi:ribonuclease PH